MLCITHRSSFRLSGVTASETLGEDLFESCLNFCMQAVIQHDYSNRLYIMPAIQHILSAHVCIRALS
jgi:hypothetical protein